MTRPYEHPATEQTQRVPLSLDCQTVVDGRAYTAERIRRAVLTLRALPDREKAWLNPNPPAAMPEPVRLAQEAYGYDSARARRFQPTNKDVDQYLEAMGWLAWLKRQNDGKRDLRVILAYVHGIPKWKLAQEFGRSDNTIQRWRNGAIERIFREFHRDILAGMDMAET